MNSEYEKKMHDLIKSAKPMTKLVEVMSGHFKRRLEEKSKAGPIIDQWLANLHCLKKWVCEKSCRIMYFVWK